MSVSDALCRRRARLIGGQQQQRAARSCALPCICPGAPLGMPVPDSSNPPHPHPHHAPMGRNVATAAALSTPRAAQVRAKHDIYNSVYAGCAAGAVLAHSAGPKGMCLGCASFAAFSAVIDKIMEHD